MALKNKVSIAFKELRKGNLGNAIKSLGNTSDFTLYPDTYRNINQNNAMWLFNLGGKGADFFFDFTGSVSCIEAYQKCAPIPAIINKKAQAFINGKTWVVDENGKEATSDLAKKIKKLLLKPNPLQSGKQFEAQGYIYQQLFGYNVVLIMKPIGYKKNIDGYSLWNIPPNYLEIQESEKLWYSLKGNEGLARVTINYKGISVPLNNEDIFMFKDFSPNFYTSYFPQSRIQGLTMPINNIIGAYETRNNLIHKRGALGILSSDKSDESGSISLTKDEKDALQQDYQQYGLTRDQWSIIISNAKVQWQQMGYPTKDLMLFEEVEDDMMRICDAYSYPYELLSSKTGTTFANLNEGKKLLYQDAIIPEAESWHEQLNSLFGLEETNITITKDFSHIPILQDDQLKKASARLILNQAKKMEYEAGLITLNQWLESLGEDGIGELGDNRATDIKNSNVPLATVIGVGGVQSLISVLTSSGMSEEARANTLQILFGLSPEDAARMVIESQQSNSQNQNNQQ